MPRKKQSSEGCNRHGASTAVGHKQRCSQEGNIETKNEKMKNFPVDKEVEGESGWKAILVDRTSPSLCVWQRSLALLRESAGATAWFLCVCVCVDNFYLCL